MAEAELVADARAEVGESPWWCAQSQALYWVDIYGRALHRFSPATKQDSVFCVPDLIAFVATHEAGGLVLALRDRIVYADRALETFTTLATPGLSDGVRLNDGTVDSSGRLWIGALDPSGASACLYRLDLDGRCAAILDGFRSVNGLAFDPSGKVLYVSDSHPDVRTIWALDYDAARGFASNRRVFVDTHGLAGRPDGGCVDTEGAYWMAAIDGGCLLRFDADGRMLSSLALPVEKPSKAAFGGRALQDLYITSLRRNLKLPLAEQPHAGGLLRVRPGVTGFPIPDCAIKLPTTSDENCEGSRGAQPRGR